MQLLAMQAPLPSILLLLQLDTPACSCLLLLLLPLLLTMVKPPSSPLPSWYASGKPVAKSSSCS
jgi:hypothetical protein